jgi:hypothetical protein
MFQAHKKKTTRTRARTHTHTHTHTHKWSTNLCSTRNQVAKLFIRRKFLTSACKVLTFHLNCLTYPHWNALNIVNHNIYKILVFRKAEGGEIWKKILFPPEILTFNLIICLQLTRESHTEISFLVTLMHYKSCIASNNLQVLIF